MMASIMILLSMTGLAIITAVVESYLMKKSVPSGTSVSMNCSLRGSHIVNHVWWFNEQIIFADSFLPKDIGIHNVKGEVHDGTSYLHIRQFSSDNSGTYKCMFGNITECTYKFTVKEPSLYLLCLEDECPKVLSLQESAPYEFHCFSDQSSGGDDFVWKINGIATHKGKKDSKRQIHVDETKITVSSSILTFYARESDTTVSCSWQNQSMIVYLNVTGGTNGKVGAMITAFLLLLLFGSLLAYLGLKRFYKHGPQHPISIPPTSVRTGLRITNSYHDISRVLSDDLEDYEGLNVLVFLPRDIYYLCEIFTSSKLHIWKGTVIQPTGETEDAIISYLDAEDKSKEHRLWQNCLNIKLTLSGHENILKTIGCCRDKGTTCIIQEYFERVTLRSVLECYHDVPVKPYNDSTKETLVQYAAGVISGMEYIASKGCCHPGISTKTVLVNYNNVCKLHDFCLVKDSKTYWDTFIVTDDDTTLELLIEVFKEYKVESDVWATGIILWEIFSLGKLPFKDADIEVKNLSQRKVPLDQPSGCPDEIYNIMKLCWTAQKGKYPDMGEVKCMFDNFFTNMSLETYENEVLNVLNVTSSVDTDGYETPK